MVASEAEEIVVITHVLGAIGFHQIDAAMFHVRIDAIFSILLLDDVFIDMPD
jgi:hypothetical protein